MPGDDLGKPRLQRLGEAHDGEGAAERAGDQHRRLRHANHREVEQLARATEAGIAERRDDGGIERAALLCQHFQHHRAADGGLGARGDVRHATRRSHGDQLGAGAGHELGRGDQAISDTG